MTAVTPSDGCFWITGASSGIGRSLALELARRGFTVVATARKADELNALVAAAVGLTGRIVAMPGDITDAARMAEIVAATETTVAPIAGAVLNAGIYIPVRAQTLTVEDCAKSFRVNLDGTVNGLVPLLKVMGPRRRGQIAVVSSVAGYRGLPTSAAYGATKAGLHNFCESLKFDTDNMGIKLQVVNPGFVETAATAENPFPMPHLMKVDDAARRLADGLFKDVYEITFPRRFTWQLKALSILPYGLYNALISRSTGWRGKTD
jgi:NADP-dependent 3-hydroxy acid dehydrogenase YdfG